MELVPSFAAFRARNRETANEAAQPETEVAAGIVAEAKKDDEKEEKAKDDDKSAKGDDAEKSDDKKDKKEKSAKPWEAKKESVEADGVNDTTETVTATATETAAEVEEASPALGATHIPTFESFMAARKAAATA